MKMNIYVQKKRQMVCQNVDTLVYVFDVQSQGDEWIEEMIEFRSCLRIIFENSSAPKVVWLLHKIDLIPIENRENVICILFILILCMLHNLNDKIVYYELIFRCF